MNQITHRNIKLDVFRGIAVVLVILNHLEVPKHQAAHNLTDKVFQVFRTIFSLLNQGGWTGVDLFFVLSGFLVSGLLFVEYQKTGTVNFGRFLIRRGFKLYPSFFAFLVILFVALTLFYPSNPQSFKNYVFDMLFIHNYFGGAWDHTWSLDVEEHFYLLLSLLFFILIKVNKLNQKSVIITYVILLLTGLISRLAINITHPAYDFPLQYSQTHLRLDSLFFGVLLSYFYHFKPEVITFKSKTHVPVILSCILILLLNFFFKRSEHSWISIIMLSVNPVCYGLIMITTLQAGVTLRQFKSVAYVGRKSYSIYLYHYFVYFIIVSLAKSYSYDIFKPSHWVCYFAAYVALSIALGILFTLIIEDPFLKLRDKLFPSKSKALTKVANQ